MSVTTHTANLAQKTAASERVTDSGGSVRRCRLFWVPNEEMQQKSGVDSVWRFEWPWMPLIGQLGR